MGSERTMKKKSMDRRRFLENIPPWLIIGLVIILAGVVTVMAFRNATREKSLASQTLLEKGTAVVRAFESGARTGMGMRWGGEQFQVLLEETANQPGILYLAVTDGHGKILAHSDRSRIGSRLHEVKVIEGLKPEAKEKWRVTDLTEGRKAFEVYRYFEPLAGRNAPSRRWGGRWWDWCPWYEEDSSQGLTRPIIFVALDVAPFDEALAEDIRNTVVLSSVLLLLGVGGVMMLFWAQNSRIAKRQLQDARTFSSEIINNLPVGLITTDSDGRVAVLNGAAEKISGFKAYGVIGKTPDDILPPSWCSLKDLIDKGEPVIEYETECLFQGGRSVPLSISASKIVNEEGAFLGNILIFRDMGEVKRLQEEIRRKEKLAALGGLAAGVAHEIRNPLSSIKGFAKYFAEHSAEGSEGRDLADVMSREVDRLNRVITELLDYAKPSDLKTRPTKVNDLIERSLRLIRRDAEAKGVAVEFIPYERLPQVEMDPDRFTQALLNLYLNALQAMEVGGKLTVRTTLDGSGVRIEVEDTGKGIPAEGLKNIFNPYFTTKISGTGLGLAIVHKLIEAHDGEIRVRSAPGEGATFSVLVPVRRSQGERDAGQA